MLNLQVEGIILISILFSGSVSDCTLVYWFVSLTQCQSEIPIPFEHYFLQCLVALQAAECDDGGGHPACQ